LLAVRDSARPAHSRAGQDSGGMDSAPEVSMASADSDVAGAGAAAGEVTGVSGSVGAGIPIGAWILTGTTTPTRAGAGRIMATAPLRRLVTTLQCSRYFRQSGPRFLVQLRKLRTPRAGCDFPLRGEAGRDCTPRSNERWKPMLLPGCGTPPPRLPLPSSCDGTARCSRCRVPRPPFYPPQCPPCLRVLCVRFLIILR
jgi:hypothetical protein